MKTTGAFARAVRDGAMLVALGPIYLAMPVIMTLGIVGWVVYRAIRPAPPGTCFCCSSSCSDTCLDEPPAGECF